MTEADIPWFWEIGRRRYEHRYDGLCTEQWFRNIVLKQPFTFFPTRTENAFCISMVTLLPWLPAEPQCEVVFICADEGHEMEALKLIRASVDWGRQRRCGSWKITSETDFDLSTLAKRVGAREVWPRYTLRY